MKHGGPEENDYRVAKQALINVSYLWNSMSLSHTPKFHGLLDHSVMLMCRLEGFGEIPDDNVELMHQISGWFAAQVARMKCHDKRALSHAKMEVMSHNKKMQEKIEQSCQHSKWKFKNRNIGASMVKREK